jgi:hypothetical protein
MIGETALISGVIASRSRPEGALALFRNIAIIAQSFWAARDTPVMPRLPDIGAANFPMTTFGGNESE